MAQEELFANLARLAELAHLAGLARLSRVGSLPAWITWSEEVGRLVAEERAELRALVAIVGAEQVELAELWAEVHQAALRARAIAHPVLTPWPGAGLREARRRLEAGHHLAADGTWTPRRPRMRGVAIDRLWIDDLPVLRRKASS